MSEENQEDLWQHGDPKTLDEAKRLLVHGKRCMALEDYDTATDLLEQSCKLFDLFYGVAKRECADAYLEYGNALVALANQEAGSGTDKIMKKAGIPGEEEEEEDEEEEEEEGEGEGDDEAGGDENPNSDKEKETVNGENGESKTSVSSSDDINHKANGKAEEGTKTNGTQKGDSISNNKSEINEPQPSSSSAPEPMPGTSDGGAGGEEDADMQEDEEATTIEIAWEVLCLAKRLYMEDESLEARLKLAETLQRIGEISIEWDNNDNAVSILEECLKLRTAILPPEDRLIALTYYNLGLAHSFKSDTQSANDNFRKAIDVIEKRVALLSQDLEKAKATQDTVAIDAYQKEINELKDLLPDMTMRLDDSTKEDSLKSTEVMKRTREEMQLEDEATKKVVSDKSKPVDDITHLVKRKAA